MKNPTITLESDAGTLLEIGLWEVIDRYMFNGFFQFKPGIPLKLYLNGMVVDRPPSMDGDEGDEA